MSTSSWGDAYVYDPWTNLLQKNVTYGSAESLTVSVDTANHIVGKPYDADGNLTSTDPLTFTYDAENRLTAASTGTYTFDGDSLRVVKVDSGTASEDRLYWRGATTDVLAESDLSGNLEKEFIDLNGQKIAYYGFPTSGVHYYYSDHLGSIRAITDPGGTTTQWSATYYPWGADSGGDQSQLENKYRWAGQEYDSEDQHYNFPYRNYATNYGRFMQVDPVAPDGSSPQSLNHYSYVGSKPTNASDPLGLYEDDIPDGITPFDGGDDFEGYGGPMDDDDGGWPADGLPVDPVPFHADSTAYPNGRGGNVAEVGVGVVACALEEPCGVGAVFVGTFVLVVNVIDHLKAHHDPAPPPPVVAAPKKTPPKHSGKPKGGPECYGQYQTDSAVCRSLGKPAQRARCWQSAADRLAACYAGDPEPPLWW